MTSADDATGRFDDPELPDLLARAFEQRDNGIEPDLEDLCRERPDLLEAVKLSIETSEMLPELQQQTATHDRLAGMILEGRYRLDHRLGSGAMGVVYQAHDLELKRDVAVKVLRASLLSGDKANERFDREAEVLAAIQHPSVVTIYDRSRDHDRERFLVIELLDGMSLSELIQEAEQKGNLSELTDSAWITETLDGVPLEDPNYLRTVVRWAADLASGLQAAHDKSIFHRDVKPSNIFMTREGKPVLLDFGIASQTDHASLTREYSPLGTPAYMAPEVLTKHAKPSARLDVYGLAATLYHLLTFSPPYTGTSSQVLSRLAMREPVSIKKLRPSIPRDLQAIIECGMARRPSERYASATDMENDLRAFLDHRAIKARVASHTTRAIRRLRHSQSFMVGAGVAVLSLSTWGVALAVDSYEALRQENRDTAWASIPPLLCLNYTANRDVTDAQEPEHIERLLDTAVQFSVSPIPARLRRSSYYLDRGRIAEAKADMLQLADELSTPYAKSLAACYEKLAADAKGAKSVVLIDLPEPESREDLFLAAYHYFRVDRSSVALPILELEQLQGYLPADELRTALYKPKPLTMYESALSIEHAYGHRTAMTARLLGVALFVLLRFEDATEAITDGLELAPHSHSLHHDAARAHMSLLEFETALEHIDHAIRSLPTWEKAHKVRIKILREMEAWDQMRAAITEAPVSDWDRTILQGEYEAERALHFLVDDDKSSALEAAQRASEHFQMAEQAKPFPSNSHHTLCKSILHGEENPLFDSMLELMQDDPVLPKRLEILMSDFPATLNDARSKKLTNILQKVRLQMLAENQ
ncbi:MAG: serine/threonine protein kinase [Planctomycetota bacterium]